MSSTPFLAAVRADMAELARTKQVPYPSVKARIDVAMLPGFWAVLLWRVANLLHDAGLRPFSRLTYLLNLMLFGADLHPGSTVGAGFVLPHPVGVAIASGTVIGARCNVLGRVAIGGSGNPRRAGHPVIGEDVWIMDSATVFGPLTIGDRTMIGAGAIVGDDVPADMFVHGPRRSVEFTPLAELDMLDHGGRLSARTSGPA